MTRTRSRPAGTAAKAPKATPPWKRAKPRSAASRPLSPEAKARAKARAARAGRRYPNLVDNLWAAREDRR